jgi:ubiquinone biosynthesis protein UbiJ
MKAPVVLTAAIENALNGYFSLDARAQSRLAELAGKVIALEITGLELTLYFVPHETGVQVLGHYADAPDTVIRGTPMALARLSLAEDANRVVLSGDVQIDGNTHAGRVFREALASVDLDWEELLSKAVGDMAAHQIGNALRGLGGWAKRSAGSLRMDVTEYLQEESRDLPTRYEIEDFLNRVDAFRDGVERLAARVARAARRLDDNDNT